MCDDAIRPEWLPEEYKPVYYYDSHAGAVRHVWMVPGEKVVVFKKQQPSIFLKIMMILFA